MNEIKFIRGGSWLDGRDVARAVSRGYGLPSDRDNDIGFRVVGVVRHSQ